MKKLFANLSLLAVLFALSVTTASATDFKMGENVLLEGTTVGDQYLLGGNITVKSDIAGDLYVAGGNVTINGNVANDTVIAGGKVNIMGNVSGDLRVIGGQVAVYGNISEDLVISGGQVDIGKNAVINGDVFAGAGILSIDGSVVKGLHGVLGTLMLNGSVGGDIVINVQDKMEIASSARVGGSFNYTSMIASQIPTGVVSGKVSFNKFQTEEAKESLLYLYLAERIWSFAGILILALLMSFLAPNLLKKAPAVTKENILKAFGIGLLTMIGAFIGSLILFTTLVGIPLAMIVLAAACIATYLAKIFVALFLTSYVFKLNKVASSIKLFGIITIGLVAYYLIGMIPVVGWIINFIMIIIALGTIVTLKMEVYKHLRAKKLV